MGENLNVDWLDEKVEKMPNGNGIYKLSCVLLGKKRLTYNQVYLLIYGLNKCKFNDDNIELLKKKIVEELFEIYKFNNGHYPKGVYKYNGE